MSGTFTFNVIGAPGMGFGADNIATADRAHGRETPNQTDRQFKQFVTGANACTRTRLASCVEISLFGRRPF